MLVETRIIKSFFLCFMLIQCVGVSYTFAQGLTGVDKFIASDPANMRSRLTADAESYIFVGDARYYALRFGFEYGLQNQKHLFGMSLPMVHTIFNADFGGYENTTGIGDLKMRYMFVPYQVSSNSGLQRVSAYMEVTAPTGEAQLGRGTGTWVYRPGMIFTFRPNPNISFYPDIKYQFSTEDANILSGDAPDGENTDLDGRIRNLVMALPVVAVVDNWDGWAGLNATYIQSFSEKTFYLFLRIDFGTMIGEKSSIALNITKFIAGQPRLDVLVQAKFQYFLR